jgi:hypothetical protein
MIKKRKKQIGILIFGVLLMSLASTTLVYALFSTSTPVKVNKFTVVNQSAELIEPVYEMRGSVLHKEPMVVNTGTAPCLVRLQVIVDPAEIFAANIVSKPTDEEIASLLNDGYKFWVDFQNTWEYHEDGFWYYKGILAPGADTAPLFKTVNWLNVDDNGNWLNYQDFNIYIYKEFAYTEAFTENGMKYSAIDENGNYSLENALKVWTYYTN